MKNLTDASAERAVIAGICRYGADAYYDVADIIGPTTFTIDSNAVIYKCLKHVMEADDTSVFDVPTVLSAAKEVGVAHFFDNRDEIKHLDAVIKFPVQMDNVRKFAAKIRKLEIARLLDAQLDQTKEKIGNLNGDESINHILGLAEDAIFDFGSLLGGGDDAPEIVGSDIDDYIQYLQESKVEQIGISTGYPTYDFAIGGGLRRGTVNVIGARPKTGKTLLADNIGVHIAAELNIPVLNLDTEMGMEDHRHRILAMCSEVAINDIETGKFSESPDQLNRVRQAAEKIRNIPYFHKSIGGMPFEEQLSVIRRWMAKEVGLNDDGTAKECVIIYDYLKLMSGDTITSNMAEFQVLGFMMTGLHNFALRYKVPILSFMQLNRDGINRESTDVASGSDRIIWLCSNFTIYKNKSDEEMAEDGQENGNRKLVPIIARHGAGLEPGDYINMKMKGWCAKISEGRTALELREENLQTEEGFIVDDGQEDNEEVPFL